MIRQANHTEAAQPVVTTSSSFRSHLSDYRRYLTFRRLWLLGLGFLCGAVIVGGIVYTCHIHYVANGGVGWIKLARVVRQSEDIESMNTFLPMRKVKVLGDNSITERFSGVIPYYICGDQLQSCAAFRQPVRKT